MPKGWKSFVYRTDDIEEPRKFRGFFFDDAQAKAWIKKQAEGTYELSDQGPRDFKETK